MQIPFTKCHGAKNDFLLTWADAAPGEHRLAETARAICDRYTGIGADGWMLVAAPAGRNPSIRLFNSDGSEPELSGNGTRCAAAFLIANGRAGETMEIETGAGPKHLRLVSHRDRTYEFEMAMGRPRVIDLHFNLALSDGARDVTLIDVGNPQCAVVVEDFDFDFVRVGAEIERHSHFPKRTNVSFIKRLDEHSIDVRFYERGAGFTQSSGTGSTGAAACALARALVTNPVHVHTLAGTLEVSEQHGHFSLTGPAVVIAEGVYYHEV